MSNERFKDELCLVEAILVRKADFFAILAVKMGGATILKTGLFPCFTGSINSAFSIACYFRLSMRYSSFKNEVDLLPLFDLSKKD